MSGSNAGRRRVLVVEDEMAIAEAVADRLRAEGFDVHLAHDGPSAVEAAETTSPDAVVLDVMLPGFDGIEVCRRIQATRPVPVLMVTARGDETDILVGLGVGADDYLTKPFSIRELAARVHALLRRVDRAESISSGSTGSASTGPASINSASINSARPDAGPGPDPELVLGDLRIDPVERRVHRAGAEVHLTPLEFDLLFHLARRPRAVLARERLLAEVWGSSDAAESRTVDSHVKALRRKLGPELIRTVHGVGYALETARQAPK